jgi:hypothetical protein
MSADDGSDFFERVVLTSGLAQVIAAPALRRALLRAGVDPSRMTSRDLLRAMEAIEISLRVYLPSESVAQRVEALRLLARSPDPQRHAP